jgi:hypothetical protein
MHIIEYHSQNIIRKPKNIRLYSRLLSAVTITTEAIFIGTRTLDTFFYSCGLCFCNVLVETNDFVLGAILPSRLVSELQKPSHQVWGP